MTSYASANRFKALDTEVGTDNKQQAQQTKAAADGALPDGEAQKAQTVKPEATRTQSGGAAGTTPSVPPISTPKVIKPTVERFAKRLIWSHYSMPDSYLLDGMPISTRKMTHEIGLCSASGETIDAADVSTSDQNEIIADLAQMMVTSGLVLRYPPLVSFQGPEVRLICDSESFLLYSFEQLSTTSMLGPYRITIKARGLPFRPHFWTLRGLEPSTNHRQVSADLQSFTMRNRGFFGETRIIYGTFYRIPSLSSEAAFSGDVLFVTDAATIYEYHQTPPSCEGNVATRVDQPKLPL